MPNQTILIIEDDAAGSELVSDLLSAAGYAVVCAGSAEEGVVLARMKNPALALMDLSLPAMDGLAATRLLKSDPRTRHMPVVALTARVEDGAVDAARDAGCCAFIPKPIDTQRLVAAIGTILEMEEQRQSAEAA